MSAPTDRRAAFIARRRDALVALVQHHPYSDDSTLLSLAEHDADLGGLTSARLVEMLQELLESKRIHRRGQGRHACWFTADADKVLAERQAARDATGKLERVAVPTPPAPTAANSPTTSMDGRQLARLAAPAPKIAGPELVIGVDHGARPDEAATVVVEVEGDTYTVVEGGTIERVEAPAPSVEDAPQQDEPPAECSVEPVAEAAPPAVEDLFIPTAQLPMPGTRMERIRDFVIKNPGSSVSEIRRDTLISNTDQLANTMCRNHRGLRWEVVDGVRRFWAVPARDVAPPEVKVDPTPAVTRAGDSRRTFTVDPDSATGILVAWVVAHPGHTARQAGEACGIDHKTATTLLAYHHKRQVLPLLGRRTNNANIWCWYSAEALAALEAAGESDMANEKNDVEQLDDQAAVRDLETAPGCSGVVAPRGVVGVDPSEVAAVTSDAPLAGVGGGPTEDEISRMYAEEFDQREAIRASGVCPQCGATSLADARTKCRPFATLSGDYHCDGDTYDLWPEQDDADDVAVPAAEAGVRAPVAPVKGVDGAGPSEVAHTASEAGPARCSIDIDALRAALANTRAQPDYWKEAAAQHPADWLRLHTSASPPRSGMADSAALQARIAELEAERDRLITALGEAEVQRNEARGSAYGVDRTNLHLRSEIDSLRAALADAVKERDRLERWAETMDRLRCRQAETLRDISEALDGGATRADGLPAGVAAFGQRYAQAVSDLHAARDAATRSEGERDAWKETAAQHLRNERYYRELLVEIGSQFPGAFIAEDGTEHDEVLVAKVPGLVRGALSEAAPGCSGVVAPRGVVGVDPSEVAQVTSDAQPAGAGDGRDPTVESGVGAPEAPVLHDGAGPSEVDPTASEAPTEDAQLIADLTQRVMELQAERDAFQGRATTLERVAITLQSEIQDARDWLSRLTYVGIDIPINIAAKHAFDAVRNRQTSRDSEVAKYVAFIDTARGRVLRMLGSEVDIEDQSATLDELLTSLEARVYGLEASIDSGLDRASADHAELTRLVRFLERETRKPREGETPVDTVIRFMLEDAHRLRMVAHLAVGGRWSVGENTKIEWADHTFNPWIGCTKVSAGCAHCYAEAMMDKRLGRAGWGPGQPRVHTSAANWATPIAWNKQARDEGRRFRVFCASLADVFDPEAPTRWRAELLQLIDDTPHLDWLLLTKRPELVGSLLMDASHGEMMDFRHMPNVWLGTSVENQAAADSRIPALLAVEAKVRFLSMEPLLGAVDLAYTCFNGSDSLGSMPGIHWVIVGGESGPSARPMHPDWARSLRDQCAAAHVPFLFKQWGEHIPQDHAHVLDDDDQARILTGTMPCALALASAPPLLANGGDDLSFSNRIMPTYRVGKHAAGRLLDGRTWDEVPRG